MARPLPAAAALLVAASALAVPAAAQMNEYEMRYGQTVEVSVDDLLQMTGSYIDRAVRTRGQLEFEPISGRPIYSLRGTFGGRLYIFPMPEVESEWDRQARTWVTKDVEVTGVVKWGTNPDNGQSIVTLVIWGFLGPPEEKKGQASPDVTLEDLVTKADQFDGKMVSVRGQFRGQNLFGDLPSSSRRRSADWVIKDDLYAAWVTGKKAKGPGWNLDAGLKRDTGKWLRVTGRVRTAQGVVYVEATDVLLSTAPSPTAKAEPPPLPPPPPRALKPPVIVFSLPLDGEREVPPNTVFQVQFSKDMAEDTFKGRVVLRYAGRPQPGDRDLDAVHMSYDEGPKVLQVDPGDLLRAGRVVELILLPGIKDIDGLELKTRPGVSAGAASDVLRFQIASAGLLTGPPR
jgi:hypothetical protein